ncbi:MAG TPA: trypsin-like peptidase domain-containing protein [Solirubrobacteraceae bacterium]|nr:trypsin-like peptidase domain-containing protein [Solirubrobacteraceae bacterium]
MTPRTVPVVLASAVLGASAAIGAVAAFDLGGGKTTTVVEQAPLSGPTSNASDGALTAREIYRRDAPGVAFIKADVVQRSASPFDFGMPSEQRGVATGSGFVIDGSGTILTNAHVINNATKVTVQFANHTSATARIVGKDESTDLAVLKVDPSGLDLHPLQLGDSASVQVGDPTIAIGNPFGLERTLTTGVISAVQRRIQAPNGFAIDGVIQTDAAINPGNSGGPLLDAAGRVIGINSQIETGGSGSGNVGIGFAVPIDTAKKIIPQLQKSGKVDRGYLGISSVTVDGSLKDLNLPVSEGALVQDVTPGSPADKAGIRGGNIEAQLNGEPFKLGGDIITAIEGKKVRSNEDVTNLITSKKQGDRVQVTVVRQGKEKQLDVTLGQRPGSLSLSGSQSQQP